MADEVLCAIESGVASIMTAHIALPAMGTPDVPATLVPEVIHGLQRHIFNTDVYPDFFSIPTPERPTLTSSYLKPGNVYSFSGVDITPILVNARSAVLEAARLEAVRLHGRAARRAYLFGNLDPDLSLEIMNLFREINARGTTVVVATHDRELIQRVGRRAGCLADDDPRAAVA